MRIAATPFWIALALAAVGAPPVARAEHGANLTSGTSRGAAVNPHMRFRHRDRHRDGRQEFDRFGVPFGVVEGFGAFPEAPVLLNTAPQPSSNEALRQGRGGSEAELPPCRETTSVGVVVVRGSSCRRGDR